ncbi:recombinase family protein [Streptomyces sp. NPDC059460]|uniref:recombinase family protein n=1 Tax=Streptomyces sp. NPDC059460 TaxID=3346840 RepID=UPI00369022F0
MVTTLDRLARSVQDARDIVDELTDNGVKLRIGSRVHDPDGPVAGCCSTSSRRPLSSRPTSFAPEPARAWPSGKPEGSSVDAPTTTRRRLRPPRHTRTTAHE